jgi:hypothetical protein
MARKKKTEIMNEKPMEDVRQAPEAAEDAKPKEKVTQDDVRRAMDLLRKYKAGKAQLETRAVQNEQWWKLRHWSTMDDKTNESRFESAWLFNMLLNKHADAMDNYPQPVILPRERRDEEEAQKLSKILPVVMDLNGMEDVYDAAWWSKLKNGTGIYGVFWNPRKENGLGDVEVREVDILNVFWEPGVEDIQRSPNLFCVELWDKKQMQERYPQLAKDVGGQALTITDYIHEDHVDKSEKLLVVDWYYKVEDEDGRIKLHYAKFCNDELLFASQNEAAYKNGFYDHGKYPFVFDVLFPMEGSPAGFGYIDVAKKPQMLIDSLNEIITRNAFMCGKKRFMVKEGCKINEEEFADWSKPFVHVAGNLSEENIREFSVSPVPGFIQSFQADKVEELKETSGNRDVAQGGTTAGATAASAIAAMQEAAGKLSRDMIRKGYRAMVKVAEIVLELIRQFYTEPRYFRILGDDGQEQYAIFTNSRMQPTPVDMGSDMEQGERMPVYDIKVKAQRASPYSTMSQNELMKELYGMGMFNPANADQALMVLEGMQFEGKDTIIQKVRQNGTMLQQIQQMQMEMQKMAAIIDSQNGTSIGQGMAAQQTAQAAAAQPRVSVQRDDRVGSQAEQARERAALSTRPA